MVRLICLLFAAGLAVMCLPLVSLADSDECEDPPYPYPLNPILLEQIIGTVKWQKEFGCCCYNNWLSDAVIIPAGSVPDQCCEDYAPGYTTVNTIKRKDVLPMVSPGIKNVDDDHDGNWDYHMETVQWQTSVCRYNGHDVRSCWPGWKAMTSAYIFECGACPEE
jgi:hypothetical protein